MISATILGTIDHRGPDLRTSGNGLSRLTFFVDTGHVLVRCALFGRRATDWAERLHVGQQVMVTGALGVPHSTGRAKVYLSADRVEPIDTAPEPDDWTDD